jgi:hypothetical protein
MWFAVFLHTLTYVKTHDDTVYILEVPFPDPHVFWRNSTRIEIASVTVDLHLASAIR